MDGMNLQDINMTLLNNMQSMQEMGQNIDDGSFMVGVFFGILGMSYSMYGKNSSKDIFLFSGMGLMVYPYIISGYTETMITGIILTIVPFIKNILIKS